MLWKQNSLWRPLFLSNFQMGFSNVKLTCSSLYLRLSEICFHETSNVPAGSDTGDSQHAYHLYSVGQGRAYTLHDTGDSAWERWSTITPVGGALSKKCSPDRRNARCRKHPFYCIWFLLSLLPYGHMEGPSRRRLRFGDWLTKPIPQ